MTLNHDLRDALRNQAELTSGAYLYPPSYQWLLSPRVWSPLENLVMWQLGIPLGLAALAGLALLVVRSTKTLAALVRRRVQEEDAIVTATRQAVIASFAIIVFGYVATRFAHSERSLCRSRPSSRSAPRSAWQPWPPDTEGWRPWSRGCRRRNGALGRRLCPDLPHDGDEDRGDGMARAARAAR